MFNRRTFMVTTGVGIVVGALGLDHVANASRPPVADAVTADANILTASTADAAGMAGMVMTGAHTVHNFTSGGHAVTLTENQDMASVVIQGHHAIHLDRPGTGTYHTHLLPFNLYTDPQLLVRDILSCTARSLFIV